MPTNSMVRPATNADLPAVKAAYDHHVLTTVATFDIEPPALTAWEERLAGLGSGDHLLLAEEAGRVVGYATAGPYRTRAAYARTKEVSVYLASGEEGRGVGRALYDALLARLAADGVHTVLGVVALPNDASEALHRACGFRRVGLLSEVGHKFGRWVDTAIWARVL